MTTGTQRTGTGTVHPDWVLELEGADILFGQAAPPEFKSEPWAIHFSLPSDVSELEGVVDPLLLVYAGSGFVRDVESKMDLLVAMAREQGHSCTEIGRALGVIKQTAVGTLGASAGRGQDQDRRRCGQQ